MIAFKVFGLHKKGCYRAAILMLNKAAVADVYNAHHLTSEKNHLPGVWP
jgi:hypothetical protein